MGVVGHAVGRADQLAQVGREAHHRPDEAPERGGGLDQGRGHGRARSLASRDGGRPVHQLAHGHALATQHVGLAGLALVQRQHDAGGHVVHVRHQVARVGQHLQLQLPGGRLVDDRAQLGVVAGAVDATGLDHHDRRPARDPLVGDLVRQHLGLLVERREAAVGAYVLLGHDRALGIAEGDHRRHVDDARHVGLDGRVQHPRGAAHVGVEHALALGGGDPDLVDGGAVDHRVGALNATRDRVQRAQVALDQLDAGGGQVRGLGRVAHQRSHIVAALDQQPRHPTADEARGSRHKDLHDPHPTYTRCNGADVRDPQPQGTPARAAHLGRAGGARPVRTGRAAAHRRRGRGRRDDPAAPVARPRPLLRQGQAGRAQAGDQGQRRQPGGGGRRAGTAPGAQPRGGHRHAGDRPHRGDPGHLRRPRRLGRGQAAGRAGPARVQHGPHAGAVDPPRAPRRLHRRRHRHQGPGRDADRDRPPARALADRGAAPAAGAHPRRAPDHAPRARAGGAAHRRAGRATRTRASRRC